MKGLAWNKAAIAGLAPALTTILLALDAHQGWGLGEEFWGAVLTVAFGILTFAIPNAPNAPDVGATKAA